MEKLEKVGVWEGDVHGPEQVYWHYSFPLPFNRALPMAVIVILFFGGHWNINEKHIQYPVDFFPIAPQFVCFEQLTFS